VASALACNAAHSPATLEVMRVGAPASATFLKLISLLDAVSGTEGLENFLCDIA